MDILVTILMGVAQLALVTLGIVIVLRPPRSKPGKKSFLFTFILIGLIGVFLGVFQAYNTRVNAESERSARLSIRLKLAEFINEGTELRRRCANESEPPPVAEADQWAERTEAFLRSSLDESYVARFGNAAGLPMVGTAISSIPHRTLWFGIHVRLARLNEFLEELSK